MADDPNALDHLEQLVNKSLVVTEEHEREMRYSMLETIRQYAREKLFDAQGGFDSARPALRLFRCAVGKNVGCLPLRDTFRPCINRATDEVENFRAALEWGWKTMLKRMSGWRRTFARSASLLGNLAEGVAIAKTAVERAKALPPGSRETDIRRQKLIARALFMEGMVGLGVGNMPLVLQVLREAIATSRLTGDKQMLGYSLEMYYTASGFIHVPDREEAALEGVSYFQPGDQ